MDARGRLVEYSGSAAHFDYFDDCAALRFRCPCGWEGPFEELARGTYAELFDASCPRCDTMLAIVSFPTEDEVHEAAQQGNEEAKEELEGLREREAFRKRYEERVLRRPEQLPELEGSELHFDWVTEESPAGREVVIRLRPDGREVWREVEAWENWPHFVEVKRILRARYGPRFKDLTASAESELYLYGDDTSGIEKMAREELPVWWVARREEGPGDER